MELDAFAVRYPSLFHLTSPDAFRSMEKHGLLTTSTLLRRAGIADSAQLAEIYHLRRKGRHGFAVDGIGRVELRDQRPLHPAGLDRALNGAMPRQDWVNLLNDRVFLWPNRKDAQPLNRAKAARAYTATLVELRTAPLLQAFAERVELTTFNVGYTMRRPKLRDHQSFIPLAAYPATQLSTLREVTIKADIPDLHPYLISAEVLST